MRRIAGFVTVNSIRFGEYDRDCGVFSCDRHRRRRQGRAAWRRGPDLATFRQKSKRRSRRLRRYARALTRDADIADDLVQDTLVRALRSEHLFHGGEVRSWLYTILTNLNRNRLRSLSRRPMLRLARGQRRARPGGPEARRPRHRTRARDFWSRTSATRCCWWCWRASAIAKSRRCRACRSAP